MTHAKSRAKKGGLLRIAVSYLRHAPVGGIEAFLANFSRFLAGRGHDVTVLCREQERPDEPGVRVVRLASLALGSAGRIRAFARDVERHLAANRYDVVLGLGKTWAQDVLRLGGGLHATFLEMTGGDGRRRTDRVSLEIERKALAPEACRRVIANSSMVKRDVARRTGYPEARIAVVHNGVDTARFDRHQHAAAAAELRRSLGWSAGEIVVLFVGNGFQRKGLDLLWPACATARKAEARLRLLVVGDDAQMAYHQKMAAELGIADATRFAGERGDVPACYAAADVFALPTRYDPFANATLEALASGLPVVTSDRNGGA